MRQDRRIKRSQSDDEALNVKAKAMTHWEMMIALRGELSAHKLQSNIIDDLDDNNHKQILLVHGKVSLIYNGNNLLEGNIVNNAKLDNFYAYILSSEVAIISPQANHVANNKNLTEQIKNLLEEDNKSLFVPLNIKLGNNVAPYQILLEISKDSSEENADNFNIYIYDPNSKNNKINSQIAIAVNRYFNSDLKSQDFIIKNDNLYQADHLPNASESNPLAGAMIIGKIKDSITKYYKILYDKEYVNDGNNADKFKNLKAIRGMIKKMNIEANPMIPIVRNQSELNIINIKDEDSEESDASSEEKQDRLRKQKTKDLIYNNSNDDNDELVMMEPRNYNEMNDEEEKQENKEEKMASFLSLNLSSSSNKNSNEDGMNYIYSDDNPRHKIYDSVDDVSDDKLIKWIMGVIIKPHSDEHYLDSRGLAEHLKGISDDNMTGFSLKKFKPNDLSKLFSYICKKNDPELGKKFAINKCFQAFIIDQYHSNQLSDWACSYFDYIIESAKESVDLQNNNLNPDGAYKGIGAEFAFHFNRKMGAASKIVIKEIYGGTSIDALKRFIIRDNNGKNKARYCQIGELEDQEVISIGLTINGQKEFVPINSVIREVLKHKDSVKKIFGDEQDEFDEGGQELIDQKKFEKIFAAIFHGVLEELVEFRTKTALQVSCLVNEKTKPFVQGDIWRNYNWKEDHIGVFKNFYKNFVDRQSENEGKIDQKEIGQKIDQVRRLRSNSRFMMDDLILADIKDDNISENNIVNSDFDFELVEELEKVAKSKNLQKLKSLKLIQNSSNEKKKS